MDKPTFIKTYLLPMMQVLDDTITGMEYRKHSECEYVRIIHSVRSCVGEKYVNITADSNLAIVKDVLRTME